MAAATGKPSAPGVAAAAVALLVLFVAAALLGPAGASTLTVFEGPGCSGKSKDITGCGCFDITGYQGGFHFVYTEGQAANLFNGPNCASRYPPTHLNVETRNCNQFDFTTVNMFCS